MPYKDKEQQRNYQRNIGTARRTSENYQFYKFLQQFNDEELQILFKKRKEECKYSDNQKIRQLRTEMAIINDVYEKRQKEKIIYDE